MTAPTALLRYALACSNAGDVSRVQIFMLALFARVRAYDAQRAKKEWGVK